MPLPQYLLTQDEVTRAELMSFRIIMVVLLKSFFDTHPKPEAAFKEIEDAIGQIVTQLDFQAIPPERHSAFRALVIERGKALIASARSLTRVKGKPH